MGGVISCADGSNIDNSPKATYYTVTFVNDDGSVIETQTVEDGKLAQQPNDPTKEDNSTFLGWYDGDTKFSFKTSITADITLTAQWKDPSKTYYIVTFKDDDGGVLQSYEIERGKKVAPESLSSKDGYEFNGWYIEDGDSFDFETPIESNITLVPSWKKVESSGGSSGGNNQVTPGGSDASGTLGKPTVGDVSNEEVKIVQSEGWLNSAYIIFEHIDGVNYKVLIDDKELDAPLIRYYETYTYHEASESGGQVTWTKKTLSKVVRADALGLAAGSHTMKVCAVGTENEGSYSSSTMMVADHDRSGFAFAPSAATTPGAYKKDGTLKDKAIVLYVTPQTAKTVTYTAKKGTNASQDGTYTGIQNVLSETSLKNLTVPIDIRIIGTIRNEDVDSLASSAEGLQIKTTSKNGVTIEGVGHDAAVYGFGFLIREAHYVELANLGVYNFMDDGISVDTNNDYLWIHNNDISYGAVGSDSDQAKGDGSLDFKKSFYSTLSYNHFWDSGKCNLLDASPASNGSNYLTYHHNWYDHSDSRHPRIRNATAVHVYNNYYDGNAKYGVGVTSGSSAFVEGNYFRDANDPMMSSKQGTDARGSGTFSGEEGGVIKAWNNKFAENNTYNNFHYITNKYDWTHGVELGEYKEEEKTLGTQNTDGSWTIYDAKVDGTTDTIGSTSFISRGTKTTLKTSTSGSRYYQTSASNDAYTLEVPKNTTKVIITAKCGSGDAGATTTLTVNGVSSGTINNSDYADYTFAISGLSSDTTITVKNGSKSVNVTEIKVIASGGWKTIVTSGADLTNIDAYEVDSRKEQVPATVKTKSGSHMYSNFDVKLGDTGMGVTIAPTDPDKAKEDVIKCAGRHNSDFAYTFNNATDDKDYGVNNALKALVVNYKCGLTAVQGTTAGSGGSSSGIGGGDEGNKEEEKPPVTPPATGSAVVALVANGTVNPTDSRVICTSCSPNGNVTNGAVTITYAGTSYTTVKMESGSIITVKATAGATITVIGSLPSGKQDCFKVNNNTVKLDAETTETTTFQKSFTATGNDVITKGDKASIGVIVITEAE
ncbi:MAG: InlB B-repeat-containing protein [Treponemataceae bacterium]|nr:InlB B-repeat-containing protein [Treponemataceae bacterium]